MNFLKTRARLLLSCVIIAAFFIPAYNTISGFGFIRLAVLEDKAHSEINSTDILIAVLPLILIPLSALVIVFRSANHLSTRKTYLALPLLFMFFFFGVLYLSSGNTSGSFSNLKVFLQMQPGFYIAGLASFLLPFTKTYKKRHRKIVHIPDAPEPVATA